MQLAHMDTTPSLPSVQSTVLWSHLAYPQTIIQETLLLEIDVINVPVHCGMRLFKPLIGSLQIHDTGCLGNSLD